jgi:hypothetical protein
MYVSSVFHLDVAYVAMAAHTCFKYLFSCVLDVSNLCCKSGSGCCIRCYGYTHMFQEYISNVSSVSVVSCKCFMIMFQKYIGVFHMLQCVLVAGEQGPTAAAWCCHRGTVVVHVRAQDGRSKPGATARAPPWL